MNEYHPERNEIPFVLPFLNDQSTSSENQQFGHGFDPWSNHIVHFLVIHRKSKEVDIGIVNYFTYAPFSLSNIDSHARKNEKNIIVINVSLEITWVSIGES